MAINRITKIFLQSLYFAIFVASFASGATREYVVGTHDLPLMPGFTINREKTTVFDSPAGNLVDAYYVGKRQDKQKIMNFYKEALPQLGWQESDNGQFSREDETLRIVPIENKNETTLHFNIVPK